MDIKLTEDEARVLFTALTNMWAPSYGYQEFKDGVRKLCQMGGGFCCRDCPSLGSYVSRFGGFVCAKHKAAEDARFTNPGEAA